MTQVKIPKIGDTITTEWALELCEHFELWDLVYRIKDNPDKYRSWEYDGCSGVPDELLDAIFFKMGRWFGWLRRLWNKGKVTEQCLKHDLKYAYGAPGNDEERLHADMDLRNDLIKHANILPNVADFFFNVVQAFGGEEGNKDFSWAFARKES